MYLHVTRGSTTETVALVDVKYSNRKDVIVSEHIAPFSVAMHGHQEGAGGGA